MKQRILQTVEHADEPLSTNQVADQVEVDWHTAKKYLDELIEEQQLHRKDVSNRLTLYWDRELPF